MGRGILNLEEGAPSRLILLWVEGPGKDGGRE